MTMTKGEIVQEYRLSADKANQIKILADLNGVKPEEISQILREAGQTLPDGFGEKKIYHKTCAICGRPFDSLQRNAKYCRDHRKAMKGLEALEKESLEGKGDAQEEPVGILHAAPETVTRAGLLDMAKAVVCGERENQYGSPEDSFRAIADYWTVYLRQTGNLPEHRELTSEDAAIMMILLKVARQAGRGKLDNWVDIAGYAACGAEIAEG